MTHSMCCPQFQHKDYMGILSNLSKRTLLAFEKRRVTLTRYGLCACDCMPCVLILETMMLCHCDSAPMVTFYLALLEKSAEACSQPFRTTMPRSIRTSPQGHSFAPFEHSCRRLP